MERDENVDIMPENKVVIHEVSELTSEMLAKKVTAHTTLSEFLKNDCTVLVGKLGGRYTIYETKNRTPFNILVENRGIIEAHVQALMKSYETDGYLFTLIYVNENLDEIDGQHRFESAMRMGLPVRFMIQPGWGIKEVTVLNVNSRVWSTIDFMESYADRGNPNYVRFREFYNTHPYDITTCQLIVLKKRSRSRAAEDEFRAGKIEVDDGHIISAEKRHKKLAEMQQFHPHGWKSRNCVEAMMVLFETLDYDHDYMITKMKKFPIVLLINANQLRLEEYLEKFFEVYNRGRQKGKIQLSVRFK